MFYPVDHGSIIAITTIIMIVTNAIGMAMSEVIITTKIIIILLSVLVSILSQFIALWLLYYYCSYYFFLAIYAQFTIAQ